MKKMTKSEIAEAIKKYNKVGYYSTERGSWNFVYVPVAVIGETEKSWRCVVIGEDKIEFTPAQEEHSLCGHATYKVNPEKIADKPKFIAVRKMKQGFPTKLDSERYETYDPWR